MTARVAGGHDRTCAQRWRARAKQCIAKSEISDAERCAGFDSPIDFAREILGIDVWGYEGKPGDSTTTPEGGQREFLELCARYRRVACVSGHKVGKSYGVAILALWAYCSNPNTRVLITANRQDQIDDIIWEAIRQLVDRARDVMGIQIPGQLYDKAAGGMHDRTRYCIIRGRTASTPEAMQGLAADHVWVIVDEASAVKEKIYKAIMGNTAIKNAHVILIGNPTQPAGTFREAFRSRKWTEANPNGYKCLHIDTRFGPNITGNWRNLQEYDPATGGWVPRREPVPALADELFVKQNAADYGADSIEFHIRVTGSFERVDEAAIFSESIIAKATENWAERAVSAEGRVFIGIDPAGHASSGDNTAFCLRRGNVVLHLYEVQALTPDDIVVHIEGLIREFTPEGKQPKPVIMIDGSGPIGQRVVATVRAVAEKTGWIVWNVNVSAAPLRNKIAYHRHRDELWGNARDWIMREGGCFPRHNELIRQLQVAQFYEHEGAGPRGSAQRFIQAKVTPKEDMREVLERSPDLADAFCMCVWTIQGVQQQERIAIESRAATPAQWYADPLDAGPPLRGGGNGLGA